PVGDAERTRRSREREQLAAQLRDDLAAKVAALAESNEWRRFLDFAAAFHTYSFNNVILILSQHPTATRVAGFRQWQDRGRQVRKGEKAIRIYGYSRRTITSTDPDTGQDTEHTLARFPILSVFAHDQTDPIEGHPGEPEHPCQRLTGNDPADLYRRTAAVLVARGWSVERDPISGEANGYTTLDGSRRIVIDARLSPAHTAKTLLHEAAHAVLHTGPTSAGPDNATTVGHRGVCETEAESVAYVLAALHGLDTSDYSVGYIAGWSGADPDLIAATATRVLDTVRDLAAALDPDTDTEQPQ
ncbi:ArdC-like ssDNA-binding domain-containing protein, partial [Aldersonia kunmingensis]|uniref:ArdC-like ssDNA-binding domain-containing protein n=1 Tax=Aldersonia kunmingensis TaxID=408066 RepID=UPI00083525E7